MVNYNYPLEYFRDSGAIDPLQDMSFCDTWFADRYGHYERITIHGISEEDRDTYIYFETHVNAHINDSPSYQRVRFNDDGFASIVGFNSEESMEADMEERGMEPFEIELRVLFQRTTYGCPCCSEEPHREEIVQTVTVQFLPDSLDELDTEETYDNREAMMAMECLSHPELVRDD